MSASEEAVHAAWTFIALETASAVQHQFLIHQLTEAALLQEKGKVRAVEDDKQPIVL